MFSTKPYYEGYGIVYSGYRFYNPTSMKWITRDPEGEVGGLNLYLAMANSLINKIDSSGLYATKLEAVQTALVVATAAYPKFETGGFIYNQNPDSSRPECDDYEFTGPSIYNKDPIIGVHQVTKNGPQMVKRR